MSVHDIYKHIADELTNIEHHTKLLQDEIKTGVTNTRNHMQAELRCLSTEILGGKSDCYIFLDIVNSLENSLTQVDTFKECEMKTCFDKLKRTSDSLTLLLKQTQELVTMCGRTGFDCESSIKAIWSGLEIIHKDIELTIVKALTESTHCVADKEEVFKEDLRRVRNQWMSCIRNT